MMFLSMLRDLTNAVTESSYGPATVCRIETTDPERTQMTFQLVRLGWPNTAAILALAVLPAVMLVAAPHRGVEAAQLQAVEAAASCPATDMVLAAIPAATVLE